MHEAIINSRDLIILFTEDHLRSPYTRKELSCRTSLPKKVSGDDRHRPI